MQLPFFENTGISIGKHRFLTLKTVFSVTHHIVDGKAASPECWCRKSNNLPYYNQSPTT